MFRNTLRMGRFLVFSFLLAAAINGPSVVALEGTVAAKQAWEANAAPTADSSADEGNIALAATTAKSQQVA